MILFTLFYVLCAILVLVDCSLHVTGNNNSNNNLNNNTNGTGNQLQQRRAHVQSPLMDSAVIICGGMKRAREESGNGELFNPPPTPIPMQSLIILNNSGFHVDLSGSLFFTLKSAEVPAGLRLKELTLGNVKMYTFQDDFVDHLPPPNDLPKFPYSQLIFKTILSAVHSYLNRETKYPYELPEDIDLLNGMILLGHLRFRGPLAAMQFVVQPKIFRPRTITFFNPNVLVGLYEAMFGPLQTQAVVNMDKLLLVRDLVFTGLIEASKPLNLFATCRPLDGLPAFVYPNDPNMFGVWRFYRIFCSCEPKLTADITTKYIASPCILPSFYPIAVTFVRHYLLHVLKMPSLRMFEQVNNDLLMISYHSVKLIRFMEACLRADMTCTRQDLNLLLPSDPECPKDRMSIVREINEIVKPAQCPDMRMLDELVIVKLMTVFTLLVDQLIKRPKGIQIQAGKALNEKATMTKFESHLCHLIALKAGFNFRPFLIEQAPICPYNLAKLSLILQQVCLGSDDDDDFKLDGNDPVGGFTRAMQASSFPEALTKANILEKIAGQMKPFAYQSYYTQTDALIGKGAYGVVFKAVEISTNMPVAVKRAVSQANEKVGLSREYTILRILKGSPLIVESEAYFRVQSGDTPIVLHDLLVMEFVDGQPLHRAVNGLDPDVDKAVFVNLTRQFLSGVAYIHSRHFKHMDLKCDNVLVKLAKDGAGEECKVKIIDFGLAVPSNMLVTVIGTYGFMAPELVAVSGSTDSKADIWSACACILSMFDLEKVKVIDPTPEAAIAFFTGRMNAESSIDLVTTTLKRLAIYEKIKKTLVGLKLTEGGEDNLLSKFLAAFSKDAKSVSPLLVKLYLHWHVMTHQMDYSRVPAYFHNLLQKGFIADPSQRPTADELLNELSLVQ